MGVQVRRGMVLRPRAVGAHVHMVVSEPFGPTEQVVIVNWTTLDEQCVDDACLLQPGDHPALRHTSSVAYSMAQLWRIARIAFAIDNGLLVELEPLSPSVLKRIITGASASPEFPKHWTRLLPPV
ncbi:MAG: hypothetical protein HYY24_10985 [Verrucomicrobia bacterium]|nr:hypothetical protein [Verrucomicrobiota bacterium]